MADRPSDLSSVDDFYPVWEDGRWNMEALEDCKSERGNCSKYYPPLLDSIGNVKF